MLKSAFASLILILLFCASGFPQSLNLHTAGPTSPGMLSLLESKYTIREEDSLNELCLDQVQVYLTDSTFKHKRQRHKAAGLGIASPLIAIRWEALYNRKEKFIGTASNKLRVPGKALFTEYDVNWNLHPHLRGYMDLVYYGYTQQKALGRFPKDHHNYEGPPFEYPEFGMDMKPYRMHCENTPPEEFRPAITEFLYPCLRGKEKSQLSYFGEEYPSIGVYGVYCLDCNHSCHPEIHPYEWIWWLNLDPAADTRPQQRNWFIALVREGSNRMKKWSPAPRTGKASLPFVFPADKSLTVRLNHLAFSEFSEEGYSQLEKIPQDAQHFQETGYQYSLFLEDGNNAQITLETNRPMNTKALQFAFTQLNFDPARNLVSGYFSIWTSVEWVYSMQVQFDYE